MLNDVGYDPLSYSKDKLLAARLNDSAFLSSFMQFPQEIKEYILDLSTDNEEIRKKSLCSILNFLQKRQGLFLKENVRTIIESIYNPEKSIQEKGIVFQFLRIFVKSKDFNPDWIPQKIIRTLVRYFQTSKCAILAAASLIEAQTKYYNVFLLSFSNNYNNITKFIMDLFQDDFYTAKTLCISILANKAVLFNYTNLFNQIYQLIYDITKFTDVLEILHHFCTCKFFVDLLDNKDLLIISSSINSEKDIYHALILIADIYKHGEYELLTLTRTQNFFIIYYLALETLDDQNIRIACKLMNKLIKKDNEKAPLLLFDTPVIPKCLEILDSVSYQSHQNIYIFLTNVLLNLPRPVAIDFLQILNMEDYFSTIISSDDCDGKFNDTIKEMLIWLVELFQSKQINFELIGLTNEIIECLQRSIEENECQIMEYFLSQVISDCQ